MTDLCGICNFNFVLNDMNTLSYKMKKHIKMIRVFHHMYMYIHAMVSMSPRMCDCVCIVEFDEWGIGFDSILYSI